MTAVNRSWVGEFRLGDAEFAFLASLIKDRTGIVLGSHKREMLHARLAKRLRKLGLSTFHEYCALIAGPQGEEELGHALNAVTTNLTRFFREPHHFQHLKEVALPELLRRRAATGRRLRMWSAGCASGEEAYTMAMVLRDLMPDPERWDARILATDIDSDMVAKAGAGIYSEAGLEPVPEELRRRLFEPVPDQVRTWRVRDELRRLIAFKRLNLLQAWPMKGPFDVVFCRNVVIYFDRDTQRRLFDRMADILADDGYLYVGHSESLLSITDRFLPVGRTVHRKVPAPAARGRPPG